MSNQDVYEAPKDNAGPSYPDETPLDKARPKAVTLGEDNPPPIIKKQLFWDVDEGDDERPITKGEMRKFEQMFWDEAEKREQMFWDRSSRKDQMFWDEDESKKAENLTKRANEELNSIYQNKLRTGEESRLDYKSELEKLMNNPNAYSQQDKQAICDNAFSEISAAFERGGILSKAQSQEMLASNIRAGKGHSFFRGNKRRR